MTNGEPIISIRDLRKTYHVGEVDVHALRGVDLDVQAGRIRLDCRTVGFRQVDLVSHRGRADAADLRHHSHRRAAICSACPTPSAPSCARTTVGFVFQKYNLLPTLTARDNIEIARDIAHKNGPLDPQFVEVLKLLGIEEPPGSQASRAFGRRAAARRHRARHRESTRHFAGRRTHRQSRHREFERRARVCCAI